MAKYAKAPAMSIDPKKLYTADMDTTQGKIKIQLFPKKAPKTVNNFVFLARDGYYDGVTFHRVIPGFMAQCGDPTGTGSGGPGYEFEDEFSDLKHVQGSLSMANRGPGTNGSQFFICYAPQSHLNNRHTVFGQVMEGMEFVVKLRERDPQRGGAADKIVKMTVTELDG